MTTVHRFQTTKDAYDASQCDDGIRDGDILVVLPEKVVGILVKAWPTSVTPAHGEFHTLADGLTWDDVEDGRYAESARKALTLASYVHASDGTGEASPVGPRLPQRDDTIRTQEGWAIVDALEYDTQDAGVLSGPGPVLTTLTVRAYDPTAGEHREFALADIGEVVYTSDYTPPERVPYPQEYPRMSNEQAAALGYKDGEFCECSEEDEQLADFVNTEEVLTTWCRNCGGFVQSSTIIRNPKEGQ